MSNLLIYIACPYLSDNAEVMLYRFEKACQFAGSIMQRGEKVFCPVIHCHPIADIAELPKDWSFWKDYDLLFLKISYKLIVLKLDGWEKSVGVQAEIEHARNMSIPIEYADPL